MKQVYSARDLAEAQFVKGLLEAEDVPAVIQSGALQGVLGEIAVNPESLPSLWVNEPDFDRAMTVIAELRAGGPAATRSHDTWTCPNCGETLEGQFTTCWKCGAVRPESA